MDIKTLKYFLTIAEEGNITKAAERLHMSQPPLSKQIKQLEDELGVCLFIRGKKFIQLTEAGVFLKKRSEELVATFGMLERQIKEYQDGRKGHIQLGTVESFGANRLPNLMSEFHVHYPNITFWVYSTVNPDDLLNKLDRGIVDIAFIRGPFDKNKYEYFEVMTDSWGIMIPWDHPLADSKIPYVTAEMLKGETITTTTAKSRYIEEWFQNNGVTPNILCWWDSHVVGEALADRGIGLSITLSAQQHRSCGRRTVYKKLYPEIKSSIYAVWSKSRVMTDSFVHFLMHLRGDDAEEA